MKCFEHKHISSSPVSQETVEEPELSPENLIIKKCVRTDSFSIPDKHDLLIKAFNYDSLWQVYHKVIKAAERPGKINAKPLPKVLM